MGGGLRGDGTWMRIGAAKDSFQKAKQRIKKQEYVDANKEKCTKL